MQNQCGQQPPTTYQVPPCQLPTANKILEKPLKKSCSKKNLLQKNYEQNFPE